MAGTSETPPLITVGAHGATGPTGGGHHGVPTNKRVKRLTGVDRIVVALMVAVPLLLTTIFVILPAIATVALSFTSWNGIGDFSRIKWIGLKNYTDVVTIYPAFWPAVWHNVIWLLVLFLVATPAGVFLAVLIDKGLRGSRFYQTALYMPVVLSLALIAFIWQLQFSQDYGFLNTVLMKVGLIDQPIDFFGNPSYNLWAALIATSWRHIGYIMLLYLAGLKGVDPSLREAAQVDGANEVQTFFRIVFPVMRPINVIVFVITVIESLRAFDLVWVINKGRNGLELLSALVTSNVVGEASRIGFGSALATMMLVISLVFIVIYLTTVLREEDR
jgi:multiple sugar transport system permease protein